jgi:hypothetical protein
MRGGRRGRLRPCNARACQRDAASADARGATRGSGRRARPYASARWQGRGLLPRRHDGLCGLSGVGERHRQARTKWNAALSAGEGVLRQIALRSVRAMTRTPRPFCSWSKTRMSFFPGGHWRVSILRWVSFIVYWWPLACGPNADPRDGPVVARLVVPCQRL